MEGEVGMRALMDVISDGEDKLDPMMLTSSGDSPV